MSIFGIFYDACSPNMAMSRDPRSKFRKKFIFPSSAFNIRKCYKISSKKALYFRSYQPKPHGGWKTPPPPVLLRLKMEFTSLTLRITDQASTIITDGPQVTVVLHICDSGRL